MMGSTLSPSGVAQYCALSYRAPTVDGSTASNRQKGAVQWRGAWGGGPGGQVQGGRRSAEASMLSLAPHLRWPHAPRTLPAGSCGACVTFAAAGATTRHAAMQLFA